MIYVTDITQYEFCPYGLYLGRVKGVRVITPRMSFGSVYHKIAEKLEERDRDIFGIFIKEKMSAEEIAEVFCEDAKRVVKNTILRNKRRIKGDLLTTREQLNEVFSRRATEKALKLKEAMRRYKKKDVYTLVFPEALTEVSIKSKELNLSGRVDRIEKTEGTYYPVEIKTGGSDTYMEKDVLQLAGYALLMEKKFGSSVNRGIIDYVVLSRRDEIAIDKELKNKFFTIKKSVEEILNGNPPEKKKRRECNFCNFRERCWN
ncbi:MAG: CRISPR-associated protein Cas4 [Euryarchaeota archaeon]|nr:CRISPR-associated protein Cas4 [Euryarchaeota archaeon]